MSWKCKLATVKSLKADISSVSPFVGVIDDILGEWAFSLLKFITEVSHTNTQGCNHFGY